MKSAQLVPQPIKREKAFEAFTEVAELLEEHAPVWYSDGLRERVNAALSALGRKWRSGRVPQHEGTTQKYLRPVGLTCSQDNAVRLLK